MAVAVRNSPESTTSAARGSLLASSVLGAVYVLAALVVVVAGVPYLWNQGVAGWMRQSLGSFANVAALAVVEVFAAAVLWFVGVALAGGSPRPGLKAGVFTVAAFALVIAVVVSWVGETGGTQTSDTVAVMIGAGLAVLAGWFLVSPRFDERMRVFEAQGWFTAAGFKPSQGKRVRRATMLGLILLAGCGVYTLIHHQTLTTVAADWRLRLPFAGTRFTILPDVRLTVPLLLSAVAFWLSYRVVHMPTFAEFLIATEAELNKVAWPSRKGLIQDTIVVLTTVVLLTLFLFAVDVAWGRILSNPWVGVLRINPDKQTTEQTLKEPDW